MRILLAALATLITLSSAAYAGDIAIYGGDFSFTRDSKHETAFGGVEYRFNNPGLKGIWSGIRPTIGYMSDLESVSATYAGIYWDFPINKASKSGFVITPGFAPSYYTHTHDGKNLHYGLEFRSTLEATYKFENGQRLGAQVAHLSNANIGNKNPGTETVEVVYTHPLF